MGECGVKNLMAKMEEESRGKDQNNPQRHWASIAVKDDKKGRARIEG